MAQKSEEFTIDGRSFHIGDVVAPKTSGAEMGKITSIDTLHKSVKVQFTQKFNGKDSVREKEFSADQVLNRTGIRREGGKALLKEVNEHLKAGGEISTARGWEEAHKNGTFTDKVGDSIGLVEAHMKALKKEGLVKETSKGTYEPNNKGMSADQYAAKIDDPKIDSKIDDLAVKNAKTDLNNGFLAKADQWVMDKTDAKAMGSGWSDFKSVYDSIVNGSKEYSNQFYQNNSKEFAALDQIATELLGATVAGAAVTGKWAAKNMGRMAYSMAKGVGKAVFDAGKAVAKTMSPRAPQKQSSGISQAAKDAARSQYTDKAMVAAAWERTKADRAGASDRFFNKLMENQTNWESEKGKKIIADAKEKTAGDGKEAKTTKETSSKMTCKEFAKKLESIKTGYEKDLKALTEKYDTQIKEVEKLRPKCAEKTEEKGRESPDRKQEKNEEKKESRGR